MEQSFWTDRWAEGRTGWHLAEPNPFLADHWQRLEGQANASILVPLCGKSVDLSWLVAETGLRPLGVEWAEEAVADYFSEQRLQPDRQRLGDGVESWSAAGVEILCADWFAVSREHLRARAGQEIRAWWDRASLIALPPELRARYASHLSQLMPSGARGLLLSLEYPQHEMTGPPFSVEANEVQELFAEAFSVEELAWKDALPESPKRQAQGLTRFHERLYLLQRR